MDIYALSTPTQMILAWTLLGILLTWLVVFATLAFRPRPAKRSESDDAATPARSFPIISVQNMPPQQTLAPVAAQVASNGAVNQVTTAVNAESTRDAGAISTL